MANDPSQLKGVIAGRSKGVKAAATAQTTIVNFQDWLFFGTGGSVFVQVGITPAASNVAVTYAVIVLQTPDNVVICDAAINTSNSPAGWTLNLATASDIYDLAQYGSQVQAWAFAQAYVGGVPQSQYSDTMDYTVSP